MTERCISESMNLHEQYVQGIESEGEMERFEYTQCSLNLANADAIVYRFANGEVSEITAEDFDGNEKLF